MAKQCIDLNRNNLYFMALSGNSKSITPTSSPTSTSKWNFESMILQLKRRKNPEECSFKNISTPLHCAQELYTTGSNPFEFYHLSQYLSPGNILLSTTILYMYNHVHFPVKYLLLIYKTFSNIIYNYFFFVNFEKHVILV